MLLFAQFSRHILFKTWMTCGIIATLTAEVFSHEPYYRVNRVSLEEGLSASHVAKIYQDREGFIWFGAQDGLNRYDGREMRYYGPAAGESNSITSRYARTILEDTTGDLWVVMSKGLNRYDRARDAFIQYWDNAQEGAYLGSNNMVAALNGPAGLLWILTEAGLARYDPQSKTFLEFIPLPEGCHFLENRSLYFAKMDDQGGIWCPYSNMGLPVYNTNEGRWTFRLPGYRGKNIYLAGVDHQGRPWGRDGFGNIGWFATDTEIFHPIKHDKLKGGEKIFTLHTDRDGRVWMGLRDLVFWWREEDNQSGVLMAGNDGQRLPKSEVLGIYQDRGGVMWFGTRSAGAYSLDMGSLAFNHYKHVQDDKASLNDNMVLSTTETSDGTLWVGTNYGLNSMAPGERGFTRHEPDLDDPKSLNGRSVLMLFTDRNDRLWIGFRAMGLDRMESDGTFSHFLNSGKGFSPHGAILAMLDKQDGGFWVGSSYSGLIELDSQGEILKIRKKNPDQLDSPDHPNGRMIWTLTEDREGRIWMGTAGDGLDLYHPRTDKFKHFKQKPPETGGFPGNSVTAIVENEDGTFWLGFLGDGLALMHSDFKSFTRYGVEQGLPNEVVYAIIKEPQGHLWLSTNKGLSLFNPQTREFVNYGVEDGLQSSEFNFMSATRRADGRLVFGGVNGLNMFRTEDLTPSTIPPKSAITHLRLFNKRVEPSDSGPLLQTMISTRSITLQPEHGIFSLELAALHFAEPQLNRFAYRMENLHEDWIEVGADRNLAVYTRLPPGDYLFRVKAANKDGYWGPTRDLKIKMLPPLWRSPAALFFYGLALISLTGSYIRAQRRKLKQEKLVSERLRHLDQLKDKLLANTSHELRTPLHGIIGLASGLKDGVAGNLAPEAQADLDMIIWSGRRLSHLVNDILDTAQLRNNKVALNLKPVEPHRAVRAVLALSKPLADDKGLVLKSEVTTDTPMVLADRDRLEQILLNLVGNAIKFTRTGQVTVTARSLDHEWVEIRVTDTGMGVTPEQAERIFRPFEQADVSVDSAYGGAGLGLAISRQLVRLHGGTMDVTSKPGQGSQFYFTIPVTNEKYRELAAQEETLVEPTHLIQPVAPKQNGNGPLILVVDDEPVNRRVLRNLLAGEVCCLEEAHDGPTALKMLEEKRFDLVLLDIMMPEMSGYEVCETIRKKWSSSQLPIIFLTAREQANDETRGFKLGGNDYIVKPVEKDILVARVATQLTLLRFSRELEDMVGERTRELLETRDDLMNEARLAGMAEIAENVMHHVGNQMNGVQVSAHFISKTAGEKRWLRLLEGLAAKLESLDKQALSDLGISHPSEILGRIQAQLSEQLGTLEKEADGLAGRVVESVALLHEQRKYAESPKVLRSECLNNLIERILDMENHQEKVAVERDLQEIPSVRLDRARFLRVFGFLLDNALDAVSEGGLVQVGTRSQNGQVLLTISDNGVGVSKEDIEKVFNQGFTTKQDRKGMGLHYCANTIKGMGGSIRLESKGLGMGTTVILAFKLEGAVT